MVRVTPLESLERQAEYTAGTHDPSHTFFRPSPSSRPKMTSCLLPARTSQRGGNSQGGMKGRRILAASLGGREASPE